VRIPDKKLLIISMRRTKNSVKVALKETRSEIMNYFQLTEYMGN